MKMNTKKQAVIGMITVAVALMLFAALSFAGSLDPSAAPAPTMKTLDEVPPTWSQALPAAQRFELVLGGAAVLDKETGLVWEQSPSTALRPWGESMYACQSALVGNKKGWRLPTVEQLESLVDATMYPYIVLPSGHPFANIDWSYWSASTIATNTADAWVVSFLNGDLYHFDKNGGFFYRAWCVRGGQSYDGQ